LISCCVCFPWCARGHPSREAAARKRFEEEYPAALKRLQERYSQIHGSGKLSRAGLRAGKPFTRNSNIRFWIDGSNFTIETLADKDNQPPDPGPPVFRTTCWTDKGVFTAERPVGG
jgi:hypothetical protein